MTAAVHDDALRIEGELTIYRAAELKQPLLGAHRIDLSGVSEIDTAGVQVLLLAQRTAQAREHELRIVAVSSAVAEVLELLGLAGAFQPSASSHAGGRP
ncbi:MAG TPA: STAS domain-containing protein [Burkholderiales bacterium]|nr:STAS domain-containing protein [Burkholderiales bacterium]